MSENRQLSINMIASVVAFLASYLITFFLTPYIVKELGAAAYGFVGLGNQIIGYSSLVTIALNSMAGRFISIEYHKGNLEKANNYFSSVFYSNCIISIILLFLSIFLITYLEFIINIPEELQTDVKLLFIFLSFNSIIALITNVYGVSTFIKNRLDYANTRNVVGNILRAIFLISLFYFFLPHIWYFGVTGLIVTVYLAYSNIIFKNKLTPELLINKSNFNIACIKELLISGIWNLITKLSSILESGINLLIANIFVGAYLSGIYALATTIPILINSICATMAGNFAPSWTKLYACGNKNDEILTEIHKSIRIMGFIASVPIAIFVVHGKVFYKLWLPNEDASLLYWLSIVSSIVMVIAMPLEPLWQIFTITNKVKKSSLNLLIWSIVMFVCVMIGMYITENLYIRLFIIAAVKSIIGSLRTLTFLPIYGAECLGFRKNIFFFPIIKNLLSISLIIIISYSISYYCPVNWYGLILGVLLTSTCGIICNLYITLSKNERSFIYSRIKKILSKLPKLSY